ncbi:MAG TPA: tRNA (adenosine(37)-N6)-threonylcarbamoyltransferase complex dimerization subunit type 1 TsaB [Myxococcota bacterium]|nr:tRNA (adenosine(37)-N6)-threonylcarbamoyltransferase complex dimerization subunit type 1 TsaB [Myxococcota bacterium]
MLLALETSAERGGVALFEGEALLGEADVAEHERHAASLLVCLDRLLARVGRPLGDVERIALAIGPGSFTGLRIGLATALGLAFGTERQLVPVPTLAALALQADASGWIAPLLDARRSEVYAGLYDGGGRALLPDACSGLDAWLARLPAGPPLAFLGSGAELHRAALERALGPRARILPAAAGVLRARSVGRLGLRLAAAGAALPPEKVELRYLRRAEAEAKRLALHPDAESIPWADPR